MNVGNVLIGRYKLSKYLYEVNVIMDAVARRSPLPREWAIKGRR